jgi:SlyX protein
MEEQLIELQTRLAFQDDAIQALTNTVTRQQGELHDLRLDIAELQHQIRALTPPQSVNVGQDKPPHY